MPPSTVLVTGVSRYLGGAYVRALSQDPSVERIIGIDLIPPPHPIGRAEFVRVDLRNPMLGRVISQAEADTVVHMNVIATPVAAGGRISQKEINVIGTMQLLAAVQAVPTVRRLIVKSSAAVYGCSAKDPAMFTEDTGAKVLPRTGFGKDSIDVESYVRGFSRRRPGVEVMMLRFANVLGPGIRTSLSDYFSLPVLPVPMGFDARLQFVHEDDATAAMVRATLLPAGHRPGIVNVAGDGIVTLSQAAAIARRPMIPVPFPAAGMLATVLRRAGLPGFPADQIQLLSYGRGLDSTRMREVLGFTPSWSTREVFAQFAAHLRAGAADDS